MDEQNIMITLVVGGIGVLTTCIGGLWSEVRTLRKELGEQVKRDDCHADMSTCYDRLNKLEKDVAVLTTYHRGMKRN